VTPSPIRVALVTGGSGFIGRALCAQLKERGVEVRVVARDPSEGPWDTFMAIDLANHEVPRSALDGADTVFHLAARTHVTTAVADDPQHWALTADGTRRLLEASQRAGVRRFVFMSSAKAAGQGRDTVVDEDFDRPPETGYGRAKREAERLVLQTVTNSRMHAVVLRPTLVYGPGWKGNLARMFRAVQTGRFPPLPGNGNRRSMVHVSDVATAAFLAAERLEALGRVYLLSDGEAYSTRRVYEAMCHAVGRRVPRWHVPMWALEGAARAGDLVGGFLGRSVAFDTQALDQLLGSALYDSSRARRELQWTPVHTFEEALPDIAAAADRHPSTAR
jgi:nucleoside-diphosphate-sugar epimerase